MTSATYRKIIVACLLFPAVSGCHKEDLATPGEHSRRDANGFLPPVSPSGLTATRMTPFAETGLTDGENVVYCPTYALAWKSYFGDATVKEFQENIVRDPFTLEDISAEDIRIVADADEHKVRKAREELGIDSRSPINPIHGNTYCAIRKSLPFHYDFERLPQPFRFHSDEAEIEVQAFGVTEHWDYWSIALMRVRVIDYLSPDDFVIRIENRKREEIILARIPQPDSLRAGIEQVEARVAASNLTGEHAFVANHEPFVVPVLEFSLLENFDGGSQLIQFRLDEKGAMLVSESDVGMEGGFEPGERRFIFDKPFLLLLKESPENNPYLAAWIANGDLMMRPD
ncbi:MAG: hypothetical protein AAF456_17310 [Planctomycetota bacterium]